MSALRSDRECTGDNDRAMTDLARAWVVRLASGHVSDTEMRAFKEWLTIHPAHRAHFDRERALWRAIQPLQEQFEAHDDSAGVRPIATAQRLRKKFTVSWLGGAIAACVAIAVVIVDPETRLRADHTTSVGEVARVMLPDGSVALLNTDSALAVHFDEHERGVEVLKGEAWFQVVKNPRQPFRVRAGNGVTEAVGTAFSVDDERERVVVSVTEGIVAVSTDPGEGSPSSTPPVRLTAGQSIAYSGANGLVSMQSVDVSSALDWRDGRVVIDNVPLSRAIAELDRYRPGRIVLLADGARDRHVSGTFAIDKIDEGFEGLAKVYGLTMTHVTPYLLVLSD